MSVIPAVAAQPRRAGIVIRIRPVTSATDGKALLCLHDGDAEGWPALRRRYEHLPKRASHHHHHLVKGFTDRFNVDRLVWFEAHDNAEAAIVREKRIKRWLRAWKVELIEKDNPEWRDLFPDIA